MASKTDICNFALSAIGSKRITAVTDDVERARLCDLFYDQARQEALQAHPWGPATKRDSITNDPSAPSWGYEKRYKLPPDCLRVLAISSVNQYPWEVEGAYIATHEGSPLKVKYTSDLTDTTKFSPLLVRAIGYKLALYLVDRLTDSNTNRAAVAELYEDAIREAKALDARERTPTPFGDTPWILDRATGPT